MKIFIVLGSLNAFISVALGAFGAHALRYKIAPELLVTWEKAVDYQMYHALALLIIAMSIKLWPEVRRIRTAGFLLFIGILLFSGSLYTLVLTEVRALGVITPIGGVAFLWGWVLFGMSARDFSDY